MNLKSGLFTLKTKDFLKGLLMSVIVPCGLIIQQSLDAGILTLHWKAIGMTALASGIGYIIKNFLTDDVKAAVKVVEKAKEEAKKD